MRGLLLDEMREVSLLYTVGEGERMALDKLYLGIIY